MKKRKKAVCIALILSLTLTMILGSFQVSAASSYTGKYWLKVNEQCNVVTAYKKLTENGNR